MVLEFAAVGWIVDDKWGEREPALRPPFFAGIDRPRASLAENGDRQQPLMIDLIFPRT